MSNSSKQKEINFFENTEINYNKTLDSISEGCQIIGFDWKYLYLNNAAAKHGRRNRKEFYGHTMMEIYPGIENTDMFSRLKSCMEKRTSYRLENEFIYPDSTRGWFELRIELVPDGIFVLSIDISQRKKTEQQIRYLNLTLMALRDVNQLITREKNRGHLIQKSCDLMVENRGFLFAYILLTDKENKLVSSASAGNKEMRTVYMDQLKNGHYPLCVEKILKHEKTFAVCETIINKGQHCFINRFPNDSMGFIGRLQYKEKVYGVISAYLPLNIACNPEEKSLFKELVSDISYALHSIEEEEEYKKTEEALRISENLYRSLFENMLNGFAYCKMLFDHGKPYDFEYLIVNKAFETQTGLKNVVGKKASEVIPGIQKADPKLIEIYGRVALTGIPETFEIFVESLSMWFSLSVYSTQKDYFVATFDVITERKKSEESLKFSNSLLLTQQETSLDGILVVDDNGNILTFNQKFIDMWEIPSEIIETRSDKDSLDSVLDKIVNPDQFLEKVIYLNTHQNEKSLDEIILKDGRIINRYSSPLLGLDNKNYGRVWYFRDITESKKSEEQLEKSYTALKKNLADVIDAMAKIVEIRDPYTSGHQRRVAYLATAIARDMNLNDQQIEQITRAAIIHDIGKIYIPQSILSKPGKLTDIELQLIRTHSTGGYDIIKGVDFPVSVAQSILQHHERLDGSGYPQGLKGKDICIEAKILAVADVVEAMASHRPYRPTLGIDKALEEIENNSGIKYDSDIVDVCLKLFRNKKFKFEKEK